MPAVIGRAADQDRNRPGKDRLFPEMCCSHGGGGCSLFYKVVSSRSKTYLRYIMDAILGCWNSANSPSTTYLRYLTVRRYLR